MKAGQNAPNDVDAYIAGFKPEVRAILRKIRATVRKSAPGAVERISYGMPAYERNGILAYFAAFEKHVSFFPTSSGVEKFRKDLAKYGTSKGTVRFPLGKPVPYGLISRIVKFRVRENEARAGAYNRPQEGGRRR